jgi:putative transposase
MIERSSLYKRHRFPPEIIQHVVWLYHRFNLSSRDIEDLMAERGIGVSYETIRLCVSNSARSMRGDFGAETTVTVIHFSSTKSSSRFRAVDQDGDVVDVLLQHRRDGKAAKRFFKRLLRASGSEPRRIVTDKLRS